jgi:dihydropteroate synthase
MGILNVTPDSFSDGGQFFDPTAAVTHAKTLISEGADIIDIGAESTRPGSERVTAADQIARLKDVLPAVVSLGIPVSVDTTLSEVAAYSLDTGAAIINDIAAGREDSDLLPLAARRGCPIVLMHMQGTPRDMQKDPQYHDVVAQVREFLAERIEAALAVGVARENIILDPGIGFGKKVEHNLALLAGVDKLATLGCPILIGPSRKRFLGELTQAGTATAPSRLGGTIAACLETFRRGATIFRVHDVGPVHAALAVAHAIAHL